MLCKLEQQATTITSPGSNADPVLAAVVAACGGGERRDGEDCDVGVIVAKAGRTPVVEGARLPGAVGDDVSGGRLEDGY
jgi:hypothetical protein